MCFTMAGGRPLHCPVEEKVEIVKIYYSCGENAETTRRTLYQNGVESKKWDKIYAEKITDLDHLKKLIKREARKIGSDTELLKKVCLSVTGRVQEFIATDGGSFEQTR